jgi:hypothetical protein
VLFFLAVKEALMPDTLLTNRNYWPTPDEVWNTFAAAGLVTLPLSTELLLLDVDGMIESAIDLFETACGFKPFLAAAGTRQFATTDIASRASDPFGFPARYLSLPGGIVSVDEVRLHRTTLRGSVNTGSDGIALVEDQDYRLLPVGAALRGEPFTGLAFHSGYGSLGSGSAGESGVITVTGSFGYAASVPADVRRLVLQLAVMEVAPIVQSAVFAKAGGVAGLRVRKKVGDVEKEVSQVSGTGGATTFFGGEAERSRARKRLKAAGANYRQPVLA